MIVLNDLSLTVVKNTKEMILKHGVQIIFCPFNYYGDYLDGDSFIIWNVME